MIGEKSLKKWSKVEAAATLCIFASCPQYSEQIDIYSFRRLKNIYFCFLF
jgi:hypothetical protein